MHPRYKVRLDRLARLHSIYKITFHLVLISLVFLVVRLFSSYEASSLDVYLGALSI